MGESEFERSERRQRESKIAAYDRAASFREEHATFRRYYGEELCRLVGTLTAPNGRVLEVGCGLGDLIGSLEGARRVGIDISPSMIEKAKARHKDVELYVADVERDDLKAMLGGPFDTIVLSDVVGHLADVETAFARLGPLLSEQGRLVVTYYSYAWEPILKAGEMLGLKTPFPEQNWLSMEDIENLLRLADFEVVRRGTDVLMPSYVPVVSEVANRVVAKLPVVKEASLVCYFVARYRPVELPRELPPVSVICPCRNERGNIRDIVERTPVMGPKTEIIFIDGNSTDGTVEEIQKAIAEYRGPLELRYLPQGDGKGKVDAVRKGFDAARYEVLMILDSDITVPPEDLPRFYRALVTDKGELINGVRLVYPMEGQAMRFLNLLGNKFFSVALSWLLEQPIKDSLCGTKVLRRAHYDAITQNRHYFGEFDPFGDFDLLFGAARLNLKIVDLPVRYRARQYGDTKISRFSHGWMLLKMTAFGFWKLRLG